MHPCTWMSGLHQYRYPEYLQTTVWKYNHLGAKCEICGYYSGVGRFSSSGMGHCVTGQVVCDIFYNHSASHLRRLESSTEGHTAGNVFPVLKLKYLKMQHDFIRLPL